MTQQQRIDQLAKWMKWYRKNFSRMWHKWEDEKDVRVVDISWNPFTSRKDAWILLDECIQRNLRARWFIEPGKPIAEQLTEAVWAAAGLGRRHDP